jgi:hypothetical protein
VWKLAAEEELRLEIEAKTADQKCTIQVSERSNFYSRRQRSTAAERCYELCLLLHHVALASVTAC